MIYVVAKILVHRNLINQPPYQSSERSRPDNYQKSRFCGDMCLCYGILQKNYASFADSFVDFLIVRH